MPVRIRNVSMKPVFVTVAHGHDIYLDAGSVTGVLPDDTAQDASVVDFVARRMLRIEKVRTLAALGPTGRPGRPAAAGVRPRSPSARRSAKKRAAKKPASKPKKKKSKPKKSAPARAKAARR